MKVVVVREPEDRRARLSVPIARALEKCFIKYGWKAEVTDSLITEEPDLIAGWGFRDVMHNAYDRWPDKLLHVDAGFWGRESYMKLALGGRWSSFTDREYSANRLKIHNIKTLDNHKPGKRILVCGMSAKAAISWGLKPEAWERQAVERINAAGGQSVYRPKPSWPDARPIPGSIYDRSVYIDLILSQVYGVVSHHSNAAIDALAIGLPIFVEIGIAKSMSVPKLEDIIEASAPSRERRLKFLKEVSWHQWTIPEIENGVWMKPPAPLSDSPVFRAVS